MTDLDTRLRALARDSHARIAADLSVDDDLADVRRRLVTRPIPTPEPERAWPWQRLAVAAATVLLVGGAGVLLATRGPDDELDDLVAPVSAPETTSVTTPDPSVAGATTTVPPSFGSSLATVEPALVGPGSTVTITPVGEVRRTCQDIVSVAANTSDGLVHRGLIGPTGWDTSVTPTIPACEGQLTSEPLQLVVPVDLDVGTYRFCIAGEDVPEGCAVLAVAAVTTTTAEVTTTTVGAPPASLPVGYVERVYIDEPPYFELRNVGPDGSVLGIAGAEARDELLRREIALDGDRTIRLLPEEEPYGRCDARPVGTSGPTAETTPDANLIGRVRSLAASPDGVVVVGVDVCPDGTEWGDDGTWFELRRVDLATGATTVLHVREPGEGDTFFEDRDVVYAGGELLAESVSPDGAYVAVAEPYTTEDTRYHVFDAVAGGDPIELDSACDDPRDLVGPPRFVGDGMVMVARECSPVDGEVGGLIVELVSLGTREPVWSVEVDQVAIDSYSHTVSLSARSIDGTVWALVSGSAGVEQPIRAAAVTAGVELPLPGGSIVAFDPRELIEPWDPYPS